MTRNFIFIVLFLLCSPSVFSCSRIVQQLGGAFKHEPEHLPTISGGARDFIEKTFEDSNGKTLIDYHTHILGLGSACKECFVHRDVYDFWSPLERLKFSIYMSASGVTNPERADQEYVERLVRLSRNFGRPVKSAILAMDKNFNLDGTPNYEKTRFYVPNRYVFALSQEYPDLFIPVVSVHPYRADAIEELEKWARLGVKMVKWLPNSMSIDPSHPITTKFYDTMRDHNMILLTHTGHEKAVKAEEEQELGNPLLLRKPLEHGVTVVMAHCASLGSCLDIDRDGNKQAPCYELFLRMMKEQRYEGLLFGEISAMLQYNRMPDPIITILKTPELHDRLINGTDYPLVGVNSLIRTRSLRKEGFITKTEQRYLNEIYAYNPILFDFVLKQTLRLPGTELKLSPSIFYRNLLQTEQ